MEILLAYVIGALFAASVYLLLKPNLIRLIFGLILLTTSVNLLIFSVGRLTRASPPIIEEGRKVIETPVANPLPQAMVLTSVVVSFGLLAFTVAVVYRIHKEFGTTLSDELQAAEPHRQPDNTRELTSFPTDEH